MVLSVVYIRRGEGERSLRETRYFIFLQAFTVLARDARIQEELLFLTSATNTGCKWMRQLSGSIWLTRSVTPPLEDCTASVRIKPNLRQKAAIMVLLSFQRERFCLHHCTIYIKLRNLKPEQIERGGKGGGESRNGLQNQTIRVKIWKKKPIQRCNGVNWIAKIIFNYSRNPFLRGTKH